MQFTELFKYWAIAGLLQCHAVYTQLFKYWAIVGLLQYYAVYQVVQNLSHPVNELDRERGTLGNFPDAGGCYLQASRCDEPPQKKILKSGKEMVFPSSSFTTHI